jgi:predicted aspartyl protease
MKGYVDEYGRCWIEIAVRGLRQRVVLQALVDTGFDGWVCLPLGVAIQLGLELRSVQIAELADGTEIEQLVFAGEIFFGDKWRAADTTLTNSRDAMVGTAMLLDSVLIVDFVGRTVEVVRKEQQC